MSREVTPFTKKYKKKLKFSIVNTEKMDIDRAKIVSPIFFSDFCHKKTYTQKTNIQSLCPEQKNVGFQTESPKSIKLETFINPLFFVQSHSTKAQINRLGTRNHKKQVADQYLENWSFFFSVGQSIMKAILE